MMLRFFVELQPDSDFRGIQREGVPGKTSARCTVGVCRYCNLGFFFVYSSFRMSSTYSIIDGLLREQDIQAT